MGPRTLRSNQTLPTTSQRFRTATARERHYPCQRSNTKSRTRNLSALLLLTAATLTAQTLNPIQQKIIAAVNADHDSSIQLLEKLVNINSGTLNPIGVKKISDILRPQFEALGFTCRFIPMDEVHRAGHLVAERKGTHGKRVLMIGHMDTVFEP